MIATLAICQSIEMACPKICSLKSRITEMICCEHRFGGQLVRWHPTQEAQCVRESLVFTPEEKDAVQGELALTPSLAAKQWQDLG